MAIWICPNCESVHEWDPTQSDLDQTASYCSNCAPKPPAFGLNGMTVEITKHGVTHLSDNCQIEKALCPECGMQRASAKQIEMEDEVDIAKALFGCDCGCEFTVTYNVKEVLDGSEDPG